MSTPFLFSAAHSSRINKKRRQTTNSTLQKRLQASAGSVSSSTSSRTSSPRKRPITEDEFQRLEESGLWSGGWLLDEAGQPNTVLEAMEYAIEHQFNPMPEDLRGLGISREGIAEILNFRKLLPPVVPVHHLQSLLPALTKTQRELNRLTYGNKLRRIEVTGSSASGNWEGYITAEAYDKLLNASEAVSEASKEAFLLFLRENPGETEVCGSRVDGDGGLPIEAIQDLLRGGFLTLPGPARAHVTGGEQASSIQSLTATSSMRSTGLNHKPAGPEKSFLGTIASVSSISTSAKKAASERDASSTTKYRISVPNLGMFLKLVTDSRAHLIWLLSRSPFNEATEQLLRERWDGGVSKNTKKKNSSSSSNNNNNNNKDSSDGAKWEGRTKKWRDFKGLAFEWVLGGALGGGWVEGFWAAGVGRGVRLVKGKR